ncbi:flagellar hook-length control protein FliK [Alcaligenes phenolicus]|uniref:flagellar hook-length control protein FliK n=1 Tax=Alcaligenes phenolicus TaxID=232846 RepID=UPI002CE9B8A5|nr:flagellar hook-length control protein FliK [Alcaligenes phenolicus]HRO20877.1 flagellar hook-length control protein FliK [Alcaligenes phenolicus]HRP13708.1 flagellar hook-length control protein FliK [Alcaligenes phenolicus]
MSIGGPSPLGTLLIQRLDAVLGISTGQQSNIATGARPDAISQTPGSQRAERAENQTARDQRQSVDQARAHTQGRDSRNIRTQSGQTSTDPALNARGPNTATTSSAPTTLGRTAQLILSLLERFPDRAPAIQGRQALLPGRPTMQTDGNESTRPGGDSQAGTRSGTAQNTASTIATPAQQRLPLPGGTATGGANTGSASAANAGSSAAGTGAPAGMPGAGTAATGATAHGALPTSSTAALAQHFTQALPQALQQSGLFYESHLSDLHFGQRSVGELQQEPQNLNRPAAETHTSTSQSPQTQASNQDPANSLLVRQQLDTLAHQNLQWQGQAWPDADMNWTVQRHEAQSDDETEHWSSTLQLDLPTLGPITLRLNLLNQQLLVHIQADQSAPYLDENSLPLRERLQDQGLILSQLQIEADPTLPQDLPDES